MYKLPISLALISGIFVSVYLFTFSEKRSLSFSAQNLDYNNFKREGNRLNFDLSMKQIYTNTGTNTVGIILSRVFWFEIEEKNIDASNSSVQKAFSNCEWKQFSQISKPFDWQQSEFQIARGGLKVVEATFEVRNLYAPADTGQDYGVCLATWMVEPDGKSSFAGSTGWVIKFTGKKGYIDGYRVGPELVDLFVNTGPKNKT